MLFKEEDLQLPFEEQFYFLIVHITLGQPIPVGHPAEQANVPQRLVRLGMHLAVLAPPLICSRALLLRLEMELLF